MIKKSNNKGGSPPFLLTRWNIICFHTLDLQPYKKFCKRIGKKPYIRRNLLSFHLLSLCYFFCWVFLCAFFLLIVLVPCFCFLLNDFCDILYFQLILYSKTDEKSISKWSKNKKVFLRAKNVSQIWERTWERRSLCSLKVHVCVI